MAGLEDICAKIRDEFERLDATREEALATSRRIIRNAATVIKHVHRAQFEQAAELLRETTQMATELIDRLESFPTIFAAGFVQDALKEWAEAMITACVVRGEELPDPDEAGLPYGPYGTGRAEVVGELRRHVLDLVREQDPGRAEPMLATMDDIYHAIVTFDYPDAVTQGLRHRTDAARGLVERTRGDLTNALQQARLERRLAEVRALVDTAG